MSVVDVCAAFAGLVLGIALLKFGNPVILDHMLPPPADLLEGIFQAWPLVWGYILLVPLGALALASARWDWPRPRWLGLLPCLWFGWQCLAATQTVEPRLTRLTLLHFAVTVGWFYVGMLAVSRAGRMEWFWGGLWLGFAFMLWTGFEQRFGGLEATRRLVYSQPGWQNLSPEHLKRLGSDRIFATLLYPNTLAGVLLLLLPALTVATWRLTWRLTAVTRGFLSGLLLVAGLACLYWSGSKAGWLIALTMGLVLLLRARVSRRLKLGLVIGVTILGGTGFFVRFTDYFHRGATSVSARFDYWRAGWVTFQRNPVFGSGPGTFSVSYRAIKPPGAEMALLAHNDYLEQASDSGLIGAAAYLVFVVGAMAWLRPRCWTDPLRFACWLGLLGWALQSVVEFGLYIPAVSWTAFLLMGLLWGQGEPEAARVGGGAGT